MASQEDVLAMALNCNMNRCLFRVGLLTLILVHSKVYARRLPADVVSLCIVKSCPDGTFCRVMHNSRGLKLRNPSAVCLPCVPEDTDKVCKSNDYLRAVLTGSNSRTATPLQCHLGEDNEEDRKVTANKTYVCPQGSMCVPPRVNFEIILSQMSANRLDDEPLFGVCCYGLVYAHAEAYRALVNNDAICSPCNPKCEEKFHCEKEVISGQLQYACKPNVRAGMCPVSIYAEETCFTFKSKLRECEEDRDCPGLTKCCDAPCGGSVCQKPIFKLFHDEDLGCENGTNSNSNSDYLDATSVMSNPIP